MSIINIATLYMSYTSVTLLFSESRSLFGLNNITACVFIQMQDGGVAEFDTPANLIKDHASGEPNNSLLLKLIHQTGPASAANLIAVANTAR